MNVYCNTAGFMSANMNTVQFYDVCLLRKMLLHGVKIYVQLKCKCYLRQHTGNTTTCSTTFEYYADIIVVQQVCCCPYCIIAWV